MVIVNYEQFIHDHLQHHLQLTQDKNILKAISSKDFELLLIKLYQYCEELNIIKRKIEKLKFTTDKNVIVMPKLIDSEITRIDSKAKEIGTAYSLFLMKQKKFQVLSHEANYYEAILSVMMAIVIDKCFSKEECDHLAKQVNRLFRTNTFNTKNCWKDYLSKSTKVSLSKSKQIKIETNFRGFRRQICSETSQISPYVNNQSCYRSLLSRSPIISLWHPNNEFLEFSLAKKTKKRKSFF